MEFLETIVEGERHVPEQRGPRFVFLFWLLAGSMSLIVGRSFQLQVLEGQRFRLQAEQNRVAVLPLPAQRGIMYDQHDVQLTSNVASTDVVLDPALLPTEENEAPLFDNLLRFIPITPDELKFKVTQVRQQQRRVLLYRALAHDDAIVLESALDSLPGIRLMSSSVRSYPFGQALAHVIGYTGLVGAQELGERGDLLITDVAGKSGVEKQYDQELHGRHGAAYREVDAAHRSQKELSKKPPVAGTDLKLSIDAKLQEYIYQLLQDREAGADKESDEQTTAGAVVVLDSASGAVRALVSYPAFDPNVFSKPILRVQRQPILSDPMKPLFNRAVSGTYPPGSTIKPLLAAAGLEEGLISPQTTWSSSGGIRIGEWFFPDWKAGGHGATNVTKALAESVNTFFYLLAGGDETRRGLGADKIAEYLTAFSWGKTTGIDLPNEEAGLVPNPAWKENTKGERWYIGDTYHLGIGQGDVLVTPLQVAVATAAIANGGRVPDPYIVEEQYSGQEKTSTRTPSTRQLPVDRRHLVTIRQGMRQAVIDGSARRLSSLPVAVAGKTGTAQIGGSDDTHAWFTSFGPYDEPEIVVTVLLERGGQGDEAAVPMAEKIWQWWSEHK